MKPGSRTEVEDMIVRKATNLDLERCGLLVNNTLLGADNARRLVKVDSWLSSLFHCQTIARHLSTTELCVIPRWMTSHLMFWVNGRAKVDALLSVRHQSFNA